MNVEQKKIFHPFADKPSPFEEWRQVVLIFFETFFLFMIRDIFGNMIKWTGKILGFIFIFKPLLIAGFLGEYARRCKNKVIVFFSFFFILLISNF